MTEAPAPAVPEPHSAGWHPARRRPLVTVIAIVLAVGALLLVLSA